MALIEQKKSFYWANCQLFITKIKGKRFVYGGVLLDKNEEKQEKA